jgi:phage-related protein
MRQRELLWMGSSLDDVRDFPEDVRAAIGYALWEVQRGETPEHAKPLTGLKEFRGTAVMEIVERFNTDTYRAVYAAQIGERVYVLHAFQKKAKHGIATPQRDIKLIAERLKSAQQYESARSKELEGQ